MRNLKMIKENGQNETEQLIKVQLQNMGTVNKNRVIIMKGGKSVTLFFSYETLVACDDVVSVNDWSNTTGRFLNELQDDKSQRVEHAEVLKHAQARLGKVLA